MAQGTIKTKPKTAISSRKSSGVNPKKGSRTIAPKRASLVRNAKTTKKYTASLTAKTEKTLGAKAGHLELLGGGKKDSKDAAKAKHKETTKQVEEMKKRWS